MRERAGFKRKTDAAKAYGLDYSLYKKLCDTSRALTRESAERIAQFHRVSPGWLMFGEGTAAGEFAVPLVGKLGNDQLVELYEPHAGSADALIVGTEAIAVEVLSNSMFPVAHKNDLIFFGPAKRDVDSLLGRECWVVLHDGRQYFKTLERGSRPGFYDLHCYNGAPMRDVEVHSVREFLGVKRRHATVRELIDKTVSPGARRKNGH